MTAMAATQTTSGSALFPRYFGLSLCVPLLALVAAFLGAGELRTALLYAIASSGIASFFAFPIMHLGLMKGTPGLLAGISGGMLIRMILVAAGLLSSGLKGGEALVFAFAFFLVYAGTQAVEIAYVFAVQRHNAARSQQQS